MSMTRLSQLVSRSDEARAEAALGSDHALVRVLALRRSLFVQLAVTTLPILFGIVGWMRHVPNAPFELAAAIVVALVLAGAFLFVRGSLRSLAQELIASRHDGAGVRVIDAERRRLLSRAERERAARWLEDLLRDAQNWPTVPPASRALPEVRLLVFTASEIREIAALLRSSTPNVAGVARTLRLLNAGADSLLFAGDVDRLRHELRRIRALLDSAPPVADSDRLAA